ncbi:MAG: hypothetical protein U9R79_09750 [Armatimonadota bacterium]|nr:hypothetical protein [Armatimonadota bacterium]
MRGLAAVLMTMLLACPALCQEQAEEPPAPQGEGELVIARAVWPDHDLSNTVYRVFSDQAMKQLVDAFPAGGAGGAAGMVLDPGDYYLMAVVDANGNGVPDAGDGLGFYGVETLSSQARPQPLQVREGFVGTATVPILVRMTEGNQLEALPWAVAMTRGTLSGTVTGSELPVVVALLPVAEDGRAFAALAAEDGSFSVTAAPGVYRVIAVADGDEDQHASDGDLVALRGWGEEDPAEVVADEDLPVGELALAAGAPPEELPPLVAGRVLHAGLDEGGSITVAFCAEQAMQREVATLRATADGRFAGTVEPATYYLRATVDQRSDDALGPGDMLGFYGVSDLMTERRPQALSLTTNALITGITIPITARISEEGSLTAYQSEEAADTAPADDAGDQ